MTMHAPGVTVPRAVAVVKALAHPARLRILAMLRGGDLCVCQLTAVLGLASSTVSAHLGELRRAGLVTERKEGRWVHYALVRGSPFDALVGELLEAVDGDTLIREDTRVVTALRQVPPEVLCRVGLDLEAVGIPQPRAAASTPDAV